MGNIRRLRPQAAGQIVAFRERTWPFAAFVPNFRPFALPGQLVRASRGPGPAATPTPRPRATSRNSPPMPHSDSRKRLFGCGPSHRSWARSTSLLGIGNLRWGECRGCRLRQHRRHLKVNIMGDYRKLAASPQRGLRPPSIRCLGNIALPCCAWFRNYGSTDGIPCFSVRESCGVNNSVCGEKP